MNEPTSTRLYTDVCSIIEHSREDVYNAISQKMIGTYWNIGRRIVEEEQQGKERAEYGAQIIAQLSEQLTHRYGKGERNPINPLGGQAFQPAICMVFNAATTINAIQ